MTPLHQITHKPWGSFQDFAEGKRWHLKALIIKKGQRLSLQRHTKRSEFWIVTEGKVQVQKGDEVFTLTPGQSAFIQKKEVHRIEALTNAVVVELSFGVHQEKDIVRLEDDYGRSDPKGRRSNERGSR